MMASIDICICTFRRSFLAQTLGSIAQLDHDGHAIRIIIADNDHVSSARSLVESLREEVPFPITYLHAPAANICASTTPRATR